MNKTDILIVNRNTLQMTNDLLIDLREQDTDKFNVTVIDNDSDEAGTREKIIGRLTNLHDRKPNVNAFYIQNESNMPLNHLWNLFVLGSASEYCTILNSDIRVHKNFVRHITELLDSRLDIGMTCHLTNDMDKVDMDDKLDFEIISNMMQGWDFTLRRIAFDPVPEELLWLCGDDWLWTQNYRKGLKGALIKSSPIIHFQGASGREVPLVTHGDLQRFAAIKEENNFPTMEKTWEAGYGNLKPVERI